MAYKPNESGMQWTDCIDSLLEQLSETQKDWLLKPFVLSQAMRDCAGELNVKRIKEELALPTKEEVARLALDNVQAWIRQIYIIGDNLPFSYAKVVVPIETYQKFQSDFDNLKDNLLGEKLLYTRDDLTRSPFEYACIMQGSPLYNDAVDILPINKQPAYLWARRSVFNMSIYPLLVTEVFLPDMPKYATAD